jgi:phosphatidylglycerol:prolipoprotein diacylglycerol transferase
VSYPYLSDLLKALLGVDIPLPVPMFGLFVAFAMIAAANRFRAEISRLFALKRIDSAYVLSEDADGKKRTVQIPPQDIVTNFTMAVLIAGIVGARCFHILEHLDQFQRDPLSMIFTRAGLSIFGGLIFGTVAGLIYVRRVRLPIMPLLDAVAPSMMLGYAIGRIGCQVSGDGDWGIAANLAAKPDWLPTWLWAQQYQNNIAGVDIPLPGVYPTPLYETLMALLCFICLWALRKHPFKAGWLFSVYMVLAGVERLLIEQIRINPVFEVVGLHATQAEMISVALIVAGLVGSVILAKRDVS